MEFVRRYLQQLCSSMTSTPRKNLPTVVCESDFQVESADNFSATVVVITEATLHNPIGVLNNEMATCGM